MKRFVYDCFLQVQKQDLLLEKMKEIQFYGGHFNPKEFTSMKTPPTISNQ